MEETAKEKKRGTMSGRNEEKKEGKKEKWRKEKIEDDITKCEGEKWKKQKEKEETKSNVIKPKVKDGNEKIKGKVVLASSPCKLAQ